MPALYGALPQLLSRELIVFFFHVEEGEDYTKTLSRGEITKKKGNKEETLEKIEHR